MVTNSYNSSSFLVIRLSSLGDILLTTPALRCLRKTFPAARIDVLVKNRYRELLEENQSVSSLISPAEPISWESLKEVRASLEGHYGTVVDLHTSLRSFYLRKGLRAKKVLAYDKRRRARWFLVRFKRDLYGGEFSVPLAYLNALACLGVEDDGLGLDWPRAFSKRDQFLKLASLNGSFNRKPIALCPGASFPTKRWPVEYWVELTKKLLQRESPLWVFGDESDAQIGELLREVDSKRVTNFCGRLSLSEAGAGLSFCRVAVTNDAGPAHMAAAVGVPVLVIYGSTVPQFGFRPFRVSHRIAELDLPCRPCSHLGYQMCPLQHFRCMRDQNPERMVALLDDLMN